MALEGSPLGRGFWQTVVRLAVPVSLQSLTVSLATMVDVLMLGQLGQLEVAAIGVSVCAVFLATNALNGACAAVAVLAAQHHGAHSPTGVRRSLIQGLFTAACLALALTATFVGCPRTIVEIISDQSEVLGFAANYTEVVGLSFLALAIQLPIASMFSGIGRPHLNLLLACSGVATNIVLNRCLIFGYEPLAIPAMGVVGAAWATVAARALEAGLAAAFLAKADTKLRPDWASIREALNPTRLRSFLGFCVPLAMNSTAWSVGMFIYDIIYHHMGAREIAVIAVLKPVMNLGFAFFWGVASAAGIIVGQDLGARRFAAAWTRAWALTAASVAIATGVSLAFWLARHSALATFAALPDETIELTLACLWVALATLWLRSVNVTVICGVLQSGGEHRFILLMDLGCQWACGIPLCYLAAEVFDLPLTWVFAAAACEEAIKLFICVPRVFSRKWQRTLVD